MSPLRKLFVLLTFLIFSFSMVSCQTADPVDDMDDDDEFTEFDEVEMKADEAFGDGDTFPEEDNPFAKPDETVKPKEPKKETPKVTPKETPKEPEIKESNLDRYNKYWSKRQDPAFPSSLYFLGVGQSHYKGEYDKSQAVSLATADGRAEIKGSFSAEIKSYVQTEQQKMETIKGKVRQASFFIKNTYNLEESVSGTIKGAVKKGVAYDTKNQIVYVLVVLDRKKAADIINEDLKQLKSEIQGCISNAETSRNSKNLINAAKLLSKGVNLMSQFRLKKKELIFVMPAGYVPVELDGIDEAAIIQLLSEITVDLTIMVKTRVTYIDDKGNEVVKDNDPISSAIKKELNKSSNNLISLKLATKELKKAYFDDVENWGIEELQAAAPDAQFIVLADLTVRFTQTVKYGNNIAYEAKTDFSINMIDVDSGDVTPLYSDGNAVEKSKALMNSMKTAMNSSVTKAARFVAQSIFGWINP